MMLIRFVLDNEILQKIKSRIELEKELFVGKKIYLIKASYDELFLWMEERSKYFNDRLYVYNLYDTEEERIWEVQIQILGEIQLSEV